uniref:Putative secreted protein n=1 Tax=Anopheles darlingi TaxID=43151 RepID=A0A2M4DBK8_ANODA
MHLQVQWPWRRRLCAMAFPLGFSFFTVFLDRRIHRCHFERGRGRRCVVGWLLIQQTNVRVQHFTEGGYVQVLPEQMNQQEIPDLDASNESTDVGVFGTAEATLQYSFASRRHHDDGGGVQDRHTRHHREQNEPEPEEDVDLFVKNIQRQHAESIVLLNATRGTVLMERTLGNAREYLDHGIRTILLIHVGEAQYIGSIGEESATEEFIDKEDITDHIDKVQCLADKVTEGVRIVCVNAIVEILSQPLMAVLALGSTSGRCTAHTLGDHAHTALLPVLPDPVGHVEEQSLEEQHERYPLVVAVVGTLLIVVAQSGMGNFGAHLAAMLPWQGERVGNPAVRVDHVPGDGTVVDAGDRITDQVVSRHDDAAGEQDCARDAIVTPEHHVIDDGLIDQVAHLHESGYRRNKSKDGHIG